MEVPFDLSEVIFICTANTLDSIPPALLDRMEVIEIAGYTLTEKQQIAIRHPMPKQIGEHGLKTEQVTVGTRPSLRSSSATPARPVSAAWERELAGICAAWR